MKRIAMPTMTGFEVLSIRSIMYCEAKSNMTQVYFKNGTMLICRTMKLVEAKLKPLGFVRIHRSYLINLGHVTRYVKGKIVIGNTKLQVSRQYKTKLLSGFIKV